LNIETHKIFILDARGWCFLKTPPYPRFNAKGVAWIFFLKKQIPVLFEIYPTITFESMKNFF